MLPPDFIIAIISCKTASYAILPQFRAFVNTGAYRIRSGNDRDADSRAAGRSISIHAPRRGERLLVECHSCQLRHFNPRSPQGERPNVPRPNGWEQRFQSTLPAGGATCNVIRLFCAFRLFQSTLPAGGATRRITWRSVCILISIHAPRRGSDLRRKFCDERNATDFNPRSPQGERQRPERNQALP